jgi:hypothetical protein
MNKLEFLKLIANAPKRLKGYSELLDYARNAYKQIMGVFPEGIDSISIKQAAKEASENRRKVIEFPKERITDPFKPRPGEFSVTVGGKTTPTTPEGIMDLLMGKGKAKDVNIGKAPKTTKTKPAVDPELQKAEDQKQLFMDFENRNKKGELFNISGQKGKFLTEDEFKRELESNTANFIQNSPGFNLQLIPKLKKPGAKAYNPFPDKQGDKFLTDDQRQRVLLRLENIMKDDEYQTRFANNFADLMEEGEDVIEFAPDLFKIDPPKKADGGRIGFGSGSVNAVGLPGNQTEQSQPGGQPMEMPPNLGFQPIFPMPQKNIPGSGGIKELRQFLQAVGAPELGMGFNFPVGQRGILGVGVAPSGNVGAQLRIPFKDGTPKDPSKRSFIKLMGGLAALPFVGKFFKPAAKVAKTAGPVVAEGVKLGFDKFMMLVDKIKRLGRSADDLATQERQKVTRYEGKDGSEYELVEDLTTGDIRVTKDKPGFATSGDKGFETIENRSTFEVRRGQADETTKGKTPPDEYDEGKAIADPDGTFSDFDEVDDGTVKEILEELGETRTKKASGGLAYMLGE